VPEPDEPRKERRAPKAPTGVSAKQQQRYEHRVKTAFEMLRDDDAPGAIGADEDVMMAVAEAAVGGDDESRPVTSQGQIESNMKAWEGYCAYLVIDPIRPDYESLPPAAKKREQMIYAAALPYIYVRMVPRRRAPAPAPPGTMLPCKPQNAMAILRGVKKYHADHGVETPPLFLAAKRCHELMLRYRDQWGPEALRAESKAPLTHKIICAILMVPDGEPIMPHGRPWRWSTVYGRSVRTCFHFMAQSGSRKAEVATHPKAKWGLKDYSFWHLRWRIGGKDAPNPTAAQLLSLQEGDYAVVIPASSKADQFGMRWGNRPIWLPYHPSQAINAARAFADWELTARVAPDKRRDTPLFWGAAGDGTALTQQEIELAFSRLLAHALNYDKEEAAKYSLHSFRRYLATAMMAAKCTNLQIQAALRWASEEALELYAITDESTYGSWLLRAEQQQLTATMAQHLPRPMPVIDADDACAAFMACRIDVNIEAAAGDRAHARARCLRMGGGEDWTEE